MRSHTHLLFAALFATLYLQRFPIENFLLKIGFFFAVLLGSFIPDLDHPKSAVSHKAPVTAGIVQAFTKHRGFMHSLWLPAVFFGAGFYLTKISLVLFGFSVGFISHLLSDGMTPHGVNLLHPFGLHIKGPIKTGGILEYVIAGAILVYFVSLL